MHAITHVPSPNIDDGQRTHVGRVPIDQARAARQHAAYREMLRECGAQVRLLDVNRDLPDCVFVEDTAVVLDEVAVLASMGAPARRAEVAGIEPELRKHRPVRRIEPPATLEGGDVLRVHRTLLVGLSPRTNEAGVRALDAIARPHGYRVRAVPLRDCLHLKSACTALPDQSLLVNPAWLDAEPLRDFALVPVPAEEPWAANTLLLSGCVCLSAAHGQTAEMLRARGFNVRTIDVTEFAKAEGGITCMSLLLSEAPTPT
jgi:dimethylargininase